MEVISKQRLCSTPYVNLDRAVVKTKSGGVLEHFMLDYVNNSVVALVLKGQFILMIKTKRFICGKSGWEVPGGWMLAGETPLDAVRRKVEDETGYEVKNISLLGTSVPLIGISKKNHLFFIVEIGDQISEFNKDLVEALDFFEFDKVLKMVSKGLVFDEATLSGLMMAKAESYV